MTKYVKNVKFGQSSKRWSQILTTTAHCKTNRVLGLRVRVRANPSLNSFYKALV